MQESLYEVCKGLKEMRDGELYKELGYQNFEDYTQSELGIKRRQAYNYIAVAEKLSVDFVQSTAQIGTEKLALLAKLDEPTREVLTEQVDVESVTVKELRSEISRITSENADLGQKLDAANEALETRAKQWKASLDSKQNELDELRAGNKRRYETLFNKIKDLNAQLAEAKEAASQEVAVEDTSRIEELEQQLAECKRKLDERPMVQAALPGDGGERRHGEYAAISNAVANALEDLMDFLEDNEHCSDFRYFANRAKEKLREYNSKLNDMLAKEETPCQ
jgi:DNA anti-recombination protein RmuC